MKTINSTSYELVNSLGESIKNLKLYTGEEFTTPYTGKQIIDYNTGTNILLHSIEDIAFVNTTDFTKTAQTFIKTGKYTNAHPLYDKTEYQAFWDEEERRCKEGMTLPGKLIRNTITNELEIQKVHITGEHYGYLNFAEIKRSKEFTEKKGILYSSNGEALNKTTNGASKSFSFPDFWDGDYYFFKAIELCRLLGKHLIVGKARRKGYSYKNGWLITNRVNLYKRSTCVVGAYDSASLFDDGTMNKVQNYLDFINKHTDWNKRRLHNTLEHIEIGFRYKGDDTKRGFLSNVYTAVLKTNPGGMRGKDGDIVLLEEMGKCPNSQEVLDSTMKTLSDGIYTTGLFIGFGTGGGDDNQWQGFEDNFYNPHQHKFLAFENVWDDDAIDTSCGYFHPMYMNKPGLTDIHGNSNIKAAIAFDEEEKAPKKHDISKLNAHEMEEPSKPSQAFSRATNSIFPSIEIDNQLKRVMRDPSIKGLGREGIFIKTEQGIKFVDRLSASDFEKNQIPALVNNYPVNKEDDIRGCWILWEQPYRDSNGNIPEDLYDLWNDPYAISKEKEYINVKDSLGATWLYEKSNNITSTRGDRLIGCFLGRRENTEDYDDQMFLGMLYFNGKLLYENDRGDVFSNAQKRGLLDHLKDEPEFTYQKSLQGGGKGRKKGISIASNMNRKMTGAIYLKNWLISERGIDDKGNKLLNLHYIYYIPFLKELLKYDGKRNTDLTSAAIIGMFDIKESLYKGIVPEVNNTQIEDDYFLNPYN